jgi:hypothetical protein
VKNPVSKFAFQKRNLQRYTAVKKAMETGEITTRCRGSLAGVVGLCTLNQVDP